VASICLHDKKVIEKALRKNVPLHIYSIGDLDTFFWPYTTWYARENEAEINDIALLYSGQSLPTLVGISEDTNGMRRLLESILHLLPQRFYAHLSPGLESVFRSTCRLGLQGEHFKMALLDPTAVNGFHCDGIERLSRENEKEILEFYQLCYPGNWFDPRMLETKQYFGIRREGRLASVAGIHVYSPEYGVAALGNIATDPSQRRKGYGMTVTAKTCQSLLKEVSHIGLNVRADNNPAISCYKRLGFGIVGAYTECMVQRL
jgi:GNAT superfamily N-acetyltransferase